MKKQKFIEWVNENGYSSIINVIDKDSKGNFLDITTERIYHLFTNDHQELATKAIDEIIQLKVKLLNQLRKFKFNVGDNVIFETGLTKLAGRIYRVIENENMILGYEIKAIDSTFNISNYHVSCDSIVDLINK